MNKVHWLGAIVFFVSLLSGCKSVKIKEGRVPSKYLEIAKKIEGLYKGKFEGKDAVIEIVFEGDRPLLRYSDEQGEDILGSECHSKVKELNHIFLYQRDGDYKLERADFTFDPNNCVAIEAKNLELVIRKPNELTVRILDHYGYEEQCDPPAHPYIGKNCQIVTTPIYLKGVFSGTEK